MKQRRLEDFLEKKDIDRLMLLTNQASELLVSIIGEKLSDKEDSKRDYKFKETVFHIYEIWPIFSEPYKKMYNYIKENNLYLYLEKDTTTKNNIS